jgi:battenin
MNRIFIHILLCYICFQVPFEKREFSMGITSLSDSIGIGLAGAIALPVHNILCQLPMPK